MNGIFVAAVVAILATGIGAASLDPPPCNNSEPAAPATGQVISMETLPGRDKGGKQASGSDCDLNFVFSSQEESALIQSADYPNDYPDNLQSSVCFTSPSGTRMELRCSDFNLEYGGRQCHYDFLGLGLGGDPSNLEKHCGQGCLSSPVTSTGNRLAVVFQSDEGNPPSRQPFRFQCRVAVSGSDPGETTSTQPPPSGAKCDCGRRGGNSAKVIGGREAAKHGLPWRCYLKTNSFSFFCGCSIISNNWVLTAAHCTRERGDQIYVVVGDHDRSTPREAASQEIPVARVIDHPQSNDWTLDNDVSLLKLSRPITSSSSISPVCLPFNYAVEEFEGETVTASGWGVTAAQSELASDILQVVDLPILTTQQCSRYYPGMITDNMICTHQPGKGVCYGDSGGSIDLNRNGRHYAIGVVSWGGECAGQNSPAVYAKTTKYLDWIVSTASGENFCRP